MALTGTAIDVVCVGIVVVDIFPPPLVRLPHAGELLKVNEIQLHLGGSAANCAIDLARLGIRAAICAMVGPDPFGEVARGLLSAEAVETSVLRSAARTGTSKTIMLPVVNEDRRFIHTFGANAEFGLADVDLAAVAAARALYVGGWFGLPGFSADELCQLLAWAKRHEVVTILDVIVPSDAPGPAWMDSLRPVLPLVDYFLPNSDEATLLTGETDPARQAEIFLEAGAATVAITLGVGGSVVRQRGKQIRAGIFPVTYVDGTGSGDAFDAGFITGALEGWPLERTVAFASAVAASCVTAVGTTAGVFRRGEAEAFLRSNHLSLTVSE